MKILTFDFETCDPYISRGLGSGWVYKLNVPDSDFKVLGCALRYPDGTAVYETDFDKVRAAVADCDTLLAHNACYDLGCLEVLGISYDDKKLLDTKTMSHLYDSSLLSHALDPLAQKYLNVGKEYSALTDAVWRSGVYPWLKKEEKEKAKAEKKGDRYVRVRPDEAKLLKFAYKNMDIVQEVAYEAMSSYAIRDVEVTYRMFEFLSKFVSLDLALRYSDLSRICNASRRKGVRVDLNRARQVHDRMIPIIANKHKRCFEIAGGEFNLSSPKQVAETMLALGIDVPRSASTGNPSVTTPWLKSRPEPICQAIIEARKAVKMDRDFIQKIIDMQEFTCPDANGYGRVYPEVHLLKARTGRFSSSCPNIQQIPSRDKEYAPLCRGIFVPEEGERWYSLDFSNQEGRLQVHYGYLLGCEGAAELKVLFDQDPNLDMHSKIADMTGLKRAEAKVINLALSYGMGDYKLAESMEITKEQAEQLRKEYNSLCPYLDQLKKKCMDSIKRKGTIKTLGGRSLRLEKARRVGGKVKTFEYKALNMLIQGSAADQTIAAMEQAYAKGIPFLYPIHDEICMSGNEQQALEMKTIMETCVDLQVPMVSEMNEGGADNWGEAK